MIKLILLFVGFAIFIKLFMMLGTWLANRDKHKNPYGFGNGDDETDYEESDPKRLI